MYKENKLQYNMSIIKQTHMKKLQNKNACVVKRSLRTNIAIYISFIHIKLVKTNELKYFN